MNKYLKMKEEHRKEVEAFPMFFAFDKEQFETGMKKLGLKPSETKKIYKLGNTGGFYRKDDSEKLKEMFNRHELEMKEAMLNNDEFAFDMFNYELANHEYVATFTVTDTLNALGLTLDEVSANKRLSRALEKAINAQKEYI